MTVNFHDQFEELSKLPVNETDTLDDVLCRLGEKLCLCLKVERVNIWIFKRNPNRLECIANFIMKGKKFNKGQILYEDMIPSYFSHLQSDKAIKIKNVKTSKITSELKDSYCKEHGIKAIMDIPVRIAGKLAGVICFEDCKSDREWSDDEKNFCLAVSQIVSLSIENYKRKHYEEKLEKALEDKDTLLIEMHHRLKNNLTMLVSLLRIQSRTISDPKALETLENFENQILSISKLHEQLYNSGDYLSVNLKSYIEELILSLKSSYIGHEIFKLDLENIQVKSNNAVTIGLIVNEIISNSMKHGIKINKEVELSISMKQVGQDIKLKLSDNGEGFDMTKELRNSFGLSLINDLSEQIHADIIFSSSKNGTSYAISIPN